MALIIRRPFFSWIIQHPFVPEESIKTSFFSEKHQKVTQWHVTLELLRRQYTVCEFSFLLETKLKKDVRVTDVLINIYLNNELKVSEDAEDYIFNEDSRWSRFFDATLEMKPQVQPHELEIVIIFSGMYIHGTGMRRREDINRDGLLYGEEDLMALSNDLDRLATSGDYSNMTLVSADERSFGAHTYMIQTLWENFGPVPPVCPLGISAEVLLEILRYVYSGRFPARLPGWEDPRYTTELFQVIEKHKMLDFYNVFIKGDNYHLQQTKKHVFSHCFILRLYFVAGQEINDESLTILLERRHRTTPEGEPSDLDFVFQLRSGSWLTDGKQLSILVKSRSPKVAYVQLSVEKTESVAEITEENQTDHDWAIVDTFVWTFEPRGIHQTGNLICLSGPQTVGPLVPPRDFPVVYCRFNISYTDGTTLTHVRGRDGTIQSDLTRFNSLSNRMFLLKDQYHSQDLLLQPRTSEARASMHKAIFAARVPKWRSVLSDILPLQEMPEAVSTLSLSYDALSYVMDYVYTGKMRRFPASFKNEIEAFANAGEFQCLINFLVTQGNKVIQ